jgi:hypothetical protein
MLRISGWIVLGLLLVAPALRAGAPDQTPPTAPPAHKTHHKKSKAPKPLVLPALPGGPLRQLPMDQIPPTPAKVTFQGGLLTISAQNSPMGEILREVRKLTGTSIEIPPHAAASDERVITYIGPGTPRDVLVTLLNGSSFNYVMLGSNSDPSVISSIILTTKSSAGGETQTAANVPQSSPPPGMMVPPHPMAAPPGFNQQMGQPTPPAPGDAEDANQDEQENTVDDNANSEDQAQPGQPGQVDQGQPQPDPNQPNAGPKTPEQILEMLRRQQGPGNPGVPPPPPPQQ